MKRILLALVITFFAAVVAYSAPVKKITGKLESPELALDADPATGAVLARVPGVEPFEFIIYTDGADLLQGVQILLSHPPEKALLETSEDIVSWTKQSLVVTTSQVENGSVATLDLKQAADVKYVKIQLWTSPDNEEIELRDVNVLFSQRAVAKATGIKHEVLDDNTVRVTYTTDEPVFSQVRYGSGGPALDMVVVVREKNKGHELLLENLTPGTTYAYQVVLSDGGDTGDVQTFTTTGQAPPLVQNIHIPPPATDNVSIVMTANKPVKWNLRYGLFENGLATAPPPGAPGVLEKSVNSFEQKTEFKLENLTQGTRYFFDVTITDEAGEQSHTDIYGFDTARVNFALGKEVSGTFTSELNDKFVQKTDTPLARVTDGDENYHTGFAVSHKTKLAAQWLEIDLGEKRYVADLVIIWSRLAVPEEYRAFLSAEPGAEGAKQVAPVLEIKGGKYSENVMTRNRQSPKGDILFEVSAPVKQSGRYIRLEIPEGAGISSSLGWKFAIVAEIQALQKQEK